MEYVQFLKLYWLSLSIEYPPQSLTFLTSLSFLKLFPLHSPKSGFMLLILFSHPICICYSDSFFTSRIQHICVFQILILTSSPLQPFLSPPFSSFSLSSLPFSMCTHLAHSLLFLWIYISPPCKQIMTSPNIY